MTELQFAVLQETTQEVAEVWDEPVTKKLKESLMKYFKERLQKLKHHGGQL